MLYGKSLWCYIGAATLIAQVVAADDSSTTVDESLKITPSGPSSPLILPPRNPLKYDLSDPRNETINEFYSRNNMKLYKPRINAHFGDHSLKYNLKDERLDYGYTLDGDSKLILRYDLNTESELILFNKRFK